MSFLNMINNLSQKSYTKEEIKDGVIKRYFYSKNDDDLEYIINFANSLKNIKSVALKDKLMELINNFSK